MDQRRERDAIGQSRRPADRPQQDRIEAAERAEKILRCYAAMTIVVGHAPVKPLAVEMKLAKRAFGSREHLNRGVHDFRPDAVTRV